MATPTEIDEFLARTAFENYQSMPLPHGRATPGHDVSERADLILADRVRGRSVLDVGTYYGYFPYEAMRRGARAAVGVEARRERVEVAERIRDLHGASYDVVHADALDLPFREPFDVVLCLNVLHHVEDPIAMIQQLARLCRETMILEFPTPNDRRFVRQQLGGGRGPGGVAVRALRHVQAAFLTGLMRTVDRHVPLIGVGGAPYRTFYPSPRALERMFLLHDPLFSKIEFLPTTAAGRVVAVCTVRADVRPSATSELMGTVAAGDPAPR